ncbi:MAG: copper chaperone PCu(A)C [Gammaproteobacteria bacterium]|nr:copper chaperone PCu(A)C [Gammaproteobacteria bacterium]
MSTRTCMRVLAPVLLLTGRLLHAADHPIHVIDPLAYETPPTAPTAAVYLVMHNTGTAADRLVGAATPAAGRVEIHTVELTGGVMRMRPIDGVELPAGGSAALRSGGQHLMLMDLPRPLRAGASLELTLRFQHAAERRISVPIVSRVGTPAGAAHGAAMPH